MHKSTPKNDKIKFIVWSQNLSIVPSYLKITVAFRPITYRVGLGLHAGGRCKHLRF